MAKIDCKTMIAKIKAIIGEENVSEDVLSLYEDITDTMAIDPENNWEDKYNNLAKRYRQRFESAEGEEFFKEEKKKEEEEMQKSAEEIKAETITIEDIL